MDGDRSLVKWATAAVATVVGCFLLGYFVVPWGREATPAPAPEPAPVPAKEAGEKAASAPPPARLQVTDITDKKRAELRRREEALQEAARRAAEQDRVTADDDSQMSVTLEPDTAVQPKPDEPDAPDNTVASVPPEKPSTKSEPNDDKPRAAPDTAAAQAKSTAPRRSTSEPAPEIPVPNAKRPETTSKRPPKEKATRRREQPESIQRRPQPEGTATPSGLTKVRVGNGPSAKASADRLARRLRSKGFTPAVLPEGDGYIVQLGAFKDRKGADSVADKLRASGFDPVLR